MCIKRLGNVEIQPQNLLFHGLQKELDKKLNKILANSEENIFKTLSKQIRQIERFRRAFLFVCEFIGINGIAMWQSKIAIIFDTAVKEVGNITLKKETQFVRIKVFLLKNSKSTFPFLSLLFKVKEKRVIFI